MFIIGHRGAAAHAPENTFASFDLAVAMESDSIETDIRMAKDGVLVLMHDPTVDRTTNGSGAVAAMTSAELGQLDAGSWFAERFSKERVPTLSAFLQRYAGKVHLTLEIKEDQIERQFIEAVEAAGLADTDFTVISYYVDALKKLKSWRPGCDIGLLASRIEQSNLNVCVEYGFAYICPHAAHTSVQDVTAAHERGVKVRVWGLHTEESMEAAAKLDVDGLTLDFPDKWRR